MSEWSAENWLKIPNSEQEDYQFCNCLPWQYSFIQYFTLDHCGCSDCKFESIRREYCSHWKKLGLADACWLPCDFIDVKLEIPLEKNLSN